MPEETGDELDLRGYLRVISRRKWIIVLTTFIVAATAGGVSLLQTPVYEGRADLLLQARSTETLFDPNTGARTDPARALDTEIQVLKSRPVRDLVVNRIGDVPDPMASAVGQTDVFAVKAQSTDPERAALVANTYAAAYIDFRRTQAVNDLLSAAAQIQDKIDALQKQIDAIGPPDTTKTGSTVADTAIQQRNSLIQQQVLFQQKLDQTQVGAALKTGGAQLVTPALVPESPVSPKPARNGVLGVLVGLMLGTGLAFLFEFLDDSIKSKDDLERATPGATVVGLIPAQGNWKDTGATFVVSVSESKSPAAEAYRSLRTSVQFMGLDRKIRVIQITSPSQAEGKSTTIANLAVALASAGQRVVIVDADLRRPRIHHFFGLDNTFGLTSVLVGDVSLADAMQPAPGLPRIHVLASGPIPPNPSELLAANRTAELLKTLAQHADVVLIDCPPVLPVTDATVLAPRCDATLLVVRAGRTHQGQLRRAAEVLAHVSAPVAGIVLNGLTSESGYGYSYGYGSGYRYETPAEPKRSGRQQRRDGRKEGASATPAQSTAVAAPEPRSRPKRSGPPVADGVPPERAPRRDAPQPTSELDDRPAAQEPPRSAPAPEPEPEYRGAVSAPERHAEPEPEYRPAAVAEPEPEPDPEFVAEQQYVAEPVAEYRPEPTPDLQYRPAPEPEPEPYREAEPARAIFDIRAEPVDDDETPTGEVPVVVVADHERTPGEHQWRHLPDA